MGEKVINVFRSIFSLLLSFTDLWFWPLVFIGFMLLAIIVVAIVLRKSYEKKLLRSINKLNKYFISTPYIKDENLIEFNNKMKDVPRILRNNWQAYMLDREDGPSRYINVENCIDKPLRSSSMEKHIGNFTIFTILIAVLSFLVSLNFASSKLYSSNIAENVFYALLLPAVIVVMYTIFVLMFRASKNDTYAVLYENFPLFQRNLEKAVTTLPGYVDYEILFTKKEIRDGIPILQQYLEKRAIIEQQELEKAKENAAASEEYDFSDLGVDGSLVLERAMKESETFIRTKRRLQDESNSIETEKENYKKTFETNSKDMQRKLQASRENLESLKKQQEESTNRIETNYIRKQLADEMKKQQQLEKDLDEATAKFTEEQASLQTEIEKREKEIDEKREFVEKAMLLEFKHYANTLFKVLMQKAADVSNQKLVALSEQNNDLRTLINDLEGGVNETSYDNSENLVTPEELAAGDIYDVGEQQQEVEQPQEQAAEGENADSLDDYFAQKQENQNTYFGDQCDQQADVYQDYTQVGDDQSYNQTDESGEYYTDVNQNDGYYVQQEQYPTHNAVQEVPESTPVENKKTATKTKNASEKKSSASKSVTKKGTSSKTASTKKKSAQPKTPSKGKTAAKPSPKKVTQAPKKNQKQKADELKKLNRKISKENAKLETEKNQLALELNSTLVQLGNDPSERKKRESKASTLPKEPKQRAKSRRIVNEDKKTTSRANRNLRDDGANNELDALNAEMQNLLKKAKK